jgi:hypothetical protein
VNRRVRIGWVFRRNQGWQHYPTPLKILGTGLIAVSVVVLAPELLPEAADGEAIAAPLIEDVAGDEAAAEAWVVVRRKTSEPSGV